MVCLINKDYYCLPEARLLFVAINNIYNLVYTTIISYYNNQSCNIHLIKPNKQTTYIIIF